MNHCSKQGQSPETALAMFTYNHGFTFTSAQGKERTRLPGLVLPPATSFSRYGFPLFPFVLYGKTGIRLADGLPQPNQLFLKVIFVVYALLYVVSVVLVNWLFTVVPPIILPGGEVWPPMSLFVGFIFVIRDYAQRAIGHRVLLAMLVGAGLSYFMAGPEIAFASLTAFLLSELADWAVYTCTGRPFSQRILLSSLVSAPVDSAVFLALIGMAGLGSICIMTLSKLAGAGIVFLLVRRREYLAAAN